MRPTAVSGALQESAAPSTIISLPQNMVSASNSLPPSSRSQLQAKEVVQDDEVKMASVFLMC